MRQNNDEIVIHVSAIRTYKTCPRVYYFRYVKGLVPKVENVRLSFGRAFHKALEVYYSTGSCNNATNAYIDYMHDVAAHVKASGGDVTDIDSTMNLGRQLLTAYLSYAQENDDFNVVAVEQQFKVPVWDGDVQLEINGVPVYHEGTFDGVVRNKYGTLWLMEHKTTSNFFPQQMLKVDFQIGFYMLAAVQLYDERVCGVIHNAIRKVDPKRSRGPVIHRQYLSRTAHELKMCRDYLCRVVKQIYSDKDFDPNPDYHCSWKCAYNQLCLCVQDGVDYSNLIGDQFIIEGGEAA